MTPTQFHRRLALANTFEGTALLLFLASLATLATYLCCAPHWVPLTPARLISAGVALSGVLGATGAAIRDAAWRPRG